MRYFLALAAALGIAACGERTSPPTGSTRSSEQKAAGEKPSFRGDVAPFLEKNCVTCHDGTKPAGDLVLAGRGEKAGPWRRVKERLAAGEMPPKENPRPSPTETARVLAWLEAAVRPVPGRAVDPGRVTLRRLNRAEYRNTIRDLLGVEDRSSDSFPSDDVGYGFDDVGDVLSLPPLLMEKYLAAAEKIAELAIVADDPKHPKARRFEAESLAATGIGHVVPGFGRGLFANGDVHGDVRLLRGGEYVLRARAYADQAGPEPAKMGFSFAGREAGVVEVNATRAAPEVYEVRIRAAAGVGTFSVSFTNDFYDPKNPDPTQRDRNLFIDHVEVVGPVDVLDPLPESHLRIFAADAGGDHLVRRARKVLRPLATRAYRRPVTDDEVQRLAELVEKATTDGERFERGIQLALEAMLVSPHFLFHVETHEKPDDPAAVHALGDYELATRLSYFLWSSMPDDVLFEAAATGALRGDLERHVVRMLKDPKAGALVDGFAEQWLTLRRLQSASPDPQRFPLFDERLREDMLRETQMFFEAVVWEDRSVLDLVDAPFTFVNERLARLYGIPGVEGERFRRVALTGGERGGILTQASVLTVTSFPTRTSPVRRGKWILEQILGAPTPPPPPGAGDLSDAPADVRAASMRERLEKHRRDPSCAACHERLDPLGFGLENFDAIGAWREKDGAFSVDAAGVLPDGRRFSTPAELRALVKADRGFVRTFAEKLLTYALGRGVGGADGEAIERILERAGGDGWRFSSFVLGIVRSAAFQSGRGEEPAR